MAVPQRVPLVAAQDRGQAVELHEEHPVLREGSHPASQGGGLVGVVHHPEAVQDQVGGRARSRRREPPMGEQERPGTSVRAAELQETPTVR